MGEELEKIYEALIKVEKLVELSDAYSAIVNYLLWAVIAPVGALLSAILYIILGPQLLTGILVLLMWFLLIIMYWLALKFMGKAPRSLLLHKLGEEYRVTIKNVKRKMAMVWILLFTLYVVLSIIMPVDVWYFRIIPPTALCLVVATGNLLIYLMLRKYLGIRRNEVKVTIITLYVLTPIVALASLKDMYLGYMVFAAVVGLSYLCTALYMLNHIFKYIFIER